MKHLPFAILLLTLAFNPLFSQTTLENFEGNPLISVVYTDGTLTAPVANPAPNAVNGSANCANYVRNAGAPFDVIVYQTDSASGSVFDVADVLAILGGTQTMTMDVYSPAAGIPITISLENAAAAATGFPAGRHSQYVGTTSVANAWETVSFALSSQPDMTTDPAGLDQLVVLFNSATLTGDTYLYDNLVGPDTVQGPCSGVTPDLNIFDDFECQRNATKSFSHGVLAVAANPDISAGNPSAIVGCYTRADFVEFDVIVYDFPVALDLSANNQVKLKVWSPDTMTEVRIAFQDASNADKFAASNFTSVVNAWEELTWDLSSISTDSTVVKAVILFAPGTFLGTTYYLDDFRIEGFLVDPCLSVTPAPDTLEDFLCQQNITYTFIEGDLFDVTNPSPDATNASSEVGLYVRNGALTDAWGGSLDLGPLDFSVNNQLSMHFLNSNDSVVVRIVLQNSALSDLASVDAVSTATGTWETLNFDFSSISGQSDISNIVLLIAPGDSTIGGTSYYYDNMVLGPQTGCFAPNNPTSAPNFSDDVTLSWSPVPSASSYQLSGGPISLGVNAVQLSVPGTSITVNNLNVGCYVWYVRAICAGVPGPWSAIDTFCIPKPCVLPTPISSNVTGNSVVLNWTQTPGALGYLIQGGVGTSSTAVQLQVIGGGVTSLAVNNLANATYSWRIQAVCSVSPFNGSGYTAFDVFTIPSASEKQGIGMEGFADGMHVNAYPNPVNNRLNVSIAGVETAELRLISISGQLIHQEVTANALTSLDVSQLSDGIYLLQVTSGDYTEVRKISIHH